MTEALPDFLKLGAGDWSAVSTELVLVFSGTLLLLLDAFARAARASFPHIALLALGFALFAGGADPGLYFAGAIEISNLTRYAEVVALGAALLAIMGSAALMAADKRDHGELYGLLLFAVAGVTLMVKGSDLLISFLGLELFSLSLYVLAAWYRDIPASVEAGMKYFLTGALASAFLLYGIAIVYGRLGTTRLDKIAALHDMSYPASFDTFLTIGILAIVGALGFKIALVPFHSWAPDVYQGMTTPAVTFLSTAPKAGAVIVLVRVLHAVFPTGLGEPWRPLLAILAALSVLFGNVVALAQKDVKRMLAYSGIAQMGYVAIGLAAFSDAALEGILVFLAGYLITNAAAFLTVGVLSNGEKSAHHLDDLRGLGRQRPVAALVLSLAMVSLTGIPPTVGFLGKLLVFRAAVEADLIWLALVGVFGSIISVGYYLRVVYVLWMQEPNAEVRLPEEDMLSGVAHILAALGMLFLGLFPQQLLEWTKRAAEALPLGR